MNSGFDKLNLKSILLENLNDLDFKIMTDVQEKSLPHVLDLKDVIAQAETGSGKTLAFALGILNKLEEDRKEIQSLILCPTRELAEQVAGQIRLLARKIKNVKVLTVCGGVAQNHQEVSIEYGVDIVVATPGRILKLLNEEKISLRNIHTLVFDEADRMLDMGFYDDIMAIDFFLSTKRQTLLFSATFPEKIEVLAKDLLKEPIKIEVNIAQASKMVEQIFYEINSHDEKNKSLLSVLAIKRPQSAIVFCKTKVLCQHVCDFLSSKNISALALHGDMDQNQRVVTLTKFSNSSALILVATDVAARGLDIKDVDLVINYDLPSDPHVYIHRIGRTGRGRSGVAISFFLSKNQYKLESISEISGQKMVTQRVPELISQDSFDLSPPMKTIYISGGRRDKIRPMDILGALTNVADLSGSDVGKINVLNILTYVAIKSDKVDDAIAKLNEGKIKKRKFKVGLA